MLDSDNGPSAWVECIACDGDGYFDLHDDGPDYDQDDDQPDPRIRLAVGWVPGGIDWMPDGWEREAS